MLLAIANDRRDTMDWQQNVSATIFRLRSLLAERSWPTPQGGDNSPESAMLLVPVVPVAREAVGG